MKEKIIEIIALALECKVETINLESGLGRHFKWDSLGHISIMVALEEHYQITVDDTNIEKLLTVKRIIDYLENHVSI